MTGEAGALAGLFASAFLSATLLPGNSEVVLAALVASMPGLVWPAVAVATAGNTAGGMTSWAIGRLLPAEGGRKLAPRAVALARRYGVAALLLSWVPLIGDALCAAAGALRLNAFACLAWMALGKGLRYAAIAWALPSAGA